MKDMSPEDLLKMLEGLERIKALPDDLPTVKPESLINKLDQQAT